MDDCLIHLMWYTTPDALEAEIPRALERFAARIGGRPEFITFGPGCTPAQLPLHLAQLQPLEAASVPKNSFFLSKYIGEQS